METLHYQFGVTMVVGKYDTLAYALTILHLETILHQVLKHSIYRRLVEDVAKYLVVGDVTHRCVAVNRILQSLQSILILPYSLHLLLLLIGETAVLDALFEYHRTTLEPVIVYQVMLRYSIFQLVGIVWHTLLHLEDVVCALVYLVAWCCCESHEHRIEVVEYCTILAEYRAVRLVDDYKVKPTH